MKKKKKTNFVMTARKELENYVANYLILESWWVAMHHAIRSWKNAN
jgi:hypothetical protein